MGKLRSFLKSIGPGIITGASDDDPSGIAIYAQTGAQVGYKLLWTSTLLTPLMISVQEICARIGMVTGHGLIGTMKRHYPPILLWVIAVSVLLANTLNIGADLSAMAASTALLFPANTAILAAAYTLTIIIFLVFLSYKLLTQILKWLTLSLFAYIFATYFSHPDWQAMLRDTFIPHIEFNRQTLLLIVAILGTTISPYLFFWQATEEAEDERSRGEFDKRRNIQIVSKGQMRAMEYDVSLGMIFSNLVMYFIISTSASTLFRAGINQIQSAEQAASALRPLAGDMSFLLFTLGIVGTGLLAIPVLAGSAAYAISELLGLGGSLDKSFARSKRFYAIIICSSVVALVLPLAGFSPFRALFLTGVLYGILSPFLILIILDIANRKAVMGDKVNGALSNSLGVIAFVLMSLSAVGALVL